MDSFAFRLTQEKLGRDIENEQLFARELAAAKVRIRSMQVRYVEEKDPTRQALLEIYVSVVQGAVYNEFERR